MTAQEAVGALASKHRTMLLGGTEQMGKGTEQMGTGQILGFWQRVCRTIDREQAVLAGPQRIWILSDPSPVEQPASLVREGTPISQSFPIRTRTRTRPRTRPFLYR
jgi:hypothetical protein